MDKIIIFDVDGTLIDSSLGVKNSITKVINNFDLKKLSDMELDRLIAISPIQQAFATIFDLKHDISQMCAEEYRKFYLEEGLYQASLYAGVKELLEFLQNNNYKMGLASYKRQDTLDKIIEYLDLSKYFQIILGADNENKKNKKEILSDCISHLNVDFNEVIFVGDSLSDGLAARDLTCRFIAINYGYGFKSLEEINLCQPTFIANNPLEIKSYIKSL